jgi:hypothetical protein
MNEIFKILLFVPFEEKNLLEQDETWLSNFKKAFSVGLKQIVNNKVEIDDTIYFEDNLNEKLQKNDIIIQLILNEKINLNKCIQNSNLKEKISKNQLFQLICYPFIDEAIKLGGYKSYSFFDELTNKSIKFNESLDKIKDEVWLKLLDLSLEIKRVINDLEKKDIQVSNSKAVFFAFSTPDQNNNKLIIEREIRQLGYTIYDPSGLVDNKEKLKEFISKSLNNSVLSIHIIGNTDLPIIPEDDISVVEYQNKVFVDYINNNSQAEINRLVWIPPDVKPKSEKQKLYIESFMHHVEAMDHTEIIRTPVEVLKSIIQRKLNNTILSGAEVKEFKTSNKKSIYIINNEFDSDKANEIRKELANKNIDVLVNDKTLSNIDNIRLHHKNLVMCDGVIILYTVDNRFWLNSKISDILKAPGIGRKKKYAVKALLTENKSSLNVPKDIAFIDNKAPLSNSLQPIIEILEKYDNGR